MPLFSSMLVVLLCQSSAASSAPAQTPSAAAPTAPAPIADNSFLIEEAYNQEAGVVQHITTFSRDWRTKAWDASFTQEWPFNPAPRHQLSYTITGLSAGPGTGGGLGDLFLNWRYQLPMPDGVAIAPRVSLVVPSGDADLGRGSGGVGLDLNLPISITASPRLVLHSNVGGSLTPRGRAENGDRAAGGSFRVGQSAIFLMSPRVNLMLEAIVVRGRTALTSSDAVWGNGLTINPGIRWAHNRPSGLQIVPGIAVPIDVHREGKQGVGLFGYISFEHPFGHTR